MQTIETVMKSDLNTIFVCRISYLNNCPIVLRTTLNHKALPNGQHPSKGEILIISTGIYQRGGFVTNCPFNEKKFFIYF